LRRRAPALKISIYQRLKSLIEAALEPELHHDHLRDASLVEQDRTQVTLLTVFLIVIIFILDELISPGNVAAHILEVSLVEGISQDELVGDSLF
jgi:hypothetical protein